MKKGTFIVVEGGDGSGKTTIMEYLKSLFEEAVFDRVFTREPGGTKVADEIRVVLLKRRDGDEEIEPETEIFLFEASRAQHLIRVVRPALAEGKLVITDRFDSSTFAYEICGNEREDLVPFFVQANALAVGETVPDLYIYLDVDAETGAQRRRQRNGEAEDTSYDSKALGYHERVRNGYHRFFKEFRPDRYIIIDASQPLEKVKAAVSGAISRFISE
ncbi:MAG: dTMP kinase [bacterium]